MAKDVLRTAVVLSAVDKMSTVINRAFGNAERRFGRLQKRADLVSKKAARLGKNSAAAGLAIATPIAIATKKAIDFEESMADVSKVLNLKRGSEELDSMGTRAKALAVHLAKAPNEAAKMVAALAQGGIAKKDLFDIGKFTGEMAVAFDIMGSTAGDAFTKTQNALGGTNQEIMAVMNSVNFLSDNIAAKAPQILTSLSQGGAASARMMKISGQEAAALGATFIAMGKTGSEAGTLIQAMSRGLGKNNKISKVFRESGGGLKGILKVLEVGNKLSGEKKSAFFRQFGLYGQQIALAAENTDLLTKAIALSTDKTGTANSVAKEFANRSNTRAFELKRVQSQLIATAIDVGNVMLPVISEITKAISPLLKQLSTWISKNPELTAKIVKGAAALAVMNFAISGVSFAVSGAAKAISLFSGGMKMASRFGRLFTVTMRRPGLLLKILKGRVLGFVKAFRMIGTAISWVGRLLIANPIGIAVAAIAGAAYLIWKNWEPIKAFFINLWDGIGKAFNLAVSGLTIVKDKFFNAGKNIINSIWQGMKNIANKPVEVIKGIVQKMRDYLPFSPAKVGPFRTLHKVRIIETLAESMNPKSAVNAMRNTVGLMANAVPVAGSTSSGSGFGGGGITLNYSPVINLGAGIGNDVDFMAILKTHKNELLRMLEDAMRRRDRLKF